jgi:hypothetical protein
VTEVPAGNLRKLLKRIAAYTALSLAGTCALAYAGDFCVFRLRLATNHQPLASVTVTRYYAVLQKNGKTEFFFQPPELQTCSNTLFPEGGYPPCWYLRRHTEQRTDI